MVPSAVPRLNVLVDVSRPIGTINRNTFGHFIEHFERCVYGGVFDPGSRNADERGFRTDVIAAMRRVGVPNLRWPGGNFASGYHWQDGVGPVEQRPVRFDLSWRAVETNAFGTEEFMAYATALGAAPYLCVNTGSGSLEEAARWVEYCNLPVDRYPTDFARLRAANGHPAPHGVKLWGIGNESYGAWQVGRATAGEYGRLCKQYAHFMRAVDPGLRLVAVGADVPEWDEQVLRVAGDSVDYISIHQYHGSDDYLATVGAAAHVERRLALLASVIQVVQDALRRERPIEIAMDEWNVCYPAWGLSELQPETGLDEYIAPFEQPLALKDALFAAGVFHAMFRLCRTVTLANVAQMVNVLGVLQTEGDALILSSVYHAFDLYANHTGHSALPTRLEPSDGSVPAFTVEDWRHPGPHSPGLRQSFLRFTERNVPYLDVQASLSRDGHTVYLAAVNRHPVEPMAARFDLGGRQVYGAARIFGLGGEDTHTPNSVQRPDVTYLTEQRHAWNGTYTFPPHSATVIELNLSR